MYVYCANNPFQIKEKIMMTLLLSSTLYSIVKCGVQVEEKTNACVYKRFSSLCTCTTTVITLMISFIYNGCSVPLMNHFIRLYISLSK